MNNMFNAGLIFPDFVTDLILPNNNFQKHALQNTAHLKTCGLYSFLPETMLLYSSFTSLFECK
jgi:hypothetical protein